MTHDIINWCFAFLMLCPLSFNKFVVADQMPPSNQVVVQTMNLYGLYIWQILFFLSSFIANSDVPDVLDRFELAS